MSTSHFSGAVDSVGGFSVNGTTVINSSAQIANTQTALTITTLTSPTINSTNIDAGASGTAGSVDVFPTAAANGKMIIAAVDAGGAYNTTISNSAMGQSSVISIPDPGAATSKFVLQDGTNTAVTVTTGNITTANVTNLKYGATPVAQADPASCTITAAAGASNVSTVTIQLKDGSGTNLTRSTGS